MARERERERDTDDSDSVHDVLSFLHRKVAKSKKYKNMCKELKRANQKLKAEKCAMEKDEKEKRTKVISEKEELAKRLKEKEEENEKLKEKSSKQAKDLEELKSGHKITMNNLEEANPAQKANPHKKIEEMHQESRRVKQLAKEAEDNFSAKDREHKEAERMFEDAKKAAAEMSKEVKEQVKLYRKLESEKDAMIKEALEKMRLVSSEKEELAQKVERHVEENAQLRSIAVEHARGMNKLANANQVQNENLQKKTEENNELQEEVMKARQLAKDALDNSLKRESDQKETERLLEIARQDAAKAENVSNRQRAELNGMLSASRESLSRTGGAMMMLQKVKQETWEALCKTREDLAETKEQCQEHRSYIGRLEENVDILTKRLEGARAILETTRGAVEDIKTTLETATIVLETTRGELGDTKMALKTTREELEDTKMFLETTKRELAETQNKFDERKTESEAQQEFVGLLQIKLTERTNNLQQMKQHLEESEEKKVQLEEQLKKVEKESERRRNLEKLSEEIGSASSEISTLQEIEAILIRGEKVEEVSLREHGVVFQRKRKLTVDDEGWKDSRKQIKLEKQEKISSQVILLSSAVSGCSFGGTEEKEEKTLAAKNRSSSKIVGSFEVKDELKEEAPSENYKLTMKIIEEGLNQIKKDPRASSKVIAAIKVLEDEVSGKRSSEEIKHKRKVSTVHQVRYYIFWRFDQFFCRKL